MFSSCMRSPWDANNEPQIMIFGSLLNLRGSDCSNVSESLRKYAPRMTESGFPSYKLHNHPLIVHSAGKSISVWGLIPKNMSTIPNNTKHMEKQAMRWNSWQCCNSLDGKSVSRSLQSAIEHCINVYWSGITWISEILSWSVLLAKLLCAINVKGV